MKLVVVLTLLGAAWGHDHARWDEPPKEQYLLRLKPQDLDNALEEHPYLLVRFISDDCPFCTVMYPEFAKASESLHDSHSSVQLAILNPKGDPAIIDKYSIQKYPSFKFFRSGEPVDYTGGQMAEEVLHWLAEYGGVVDKVMFFEQANDFIEDEEYAVIAMGFFKDSDESDYVKPFRQVAAELPFVKFIMAKSLTLRMEYDIERHADCLLVFNKLADETHRLSTDLTVDNMKNFIGRHSLSLVTNFTLQTARLIFGHPVQNHAVLFCKNDSKASALLDTYEKAAADFKDQVLFIYADPANGTCRGLMAFFDVRPEDTPAIRFVRGSTNVKYAPINVDLTLTGISDFVSGALNDKLEPYYKSEQVPNGWDAKPVKVLVGTNYDSVTRDKTKHVFVELYGPDCRECHQLEPIWNSLAEKYSKHKDLVFAKINLRLNDLKDTSDKHVPSLVFFPKNSEEAVVYSGKLTREEICHFLQSVGAVPNEDKDEL